MTDFMYEVKDCTRCRRKGLPLDAFYFGANGKPQSWCKECVRERQRLRASGRQDSTLRTCRRCKRSVNASDFNPRKGWCPECENDGHKSRYHSLTPEERTIENRRNSLRKVYKLTLEEYEAMAAGGCYICGVKEDLCVDHDHRCCSGKYTCGKCVRGVLCHKHNRGEGAFESIEEIESLLRYRLKFEKGEIYNNEV